MKKVSAIAPPPVPRALAVLLLLAAAALLAACAPRGETASVSFMVFGDPEELRAYRQLVEAFQARQPGVRVELIHIPGQADYRRRLTTDFAAGAPADVVLLNYRRYATFAARGVLEPLGPYLRRSTVIREADFFPEALAPFRWQGELVGIPQNLSSLVIYYNQNLFDAAQVPYPDAGWD